MDAMSKIESIRSRISTANAQSVTLNNQRQMNIGKRATLEAQLAKAFADYEAQYGKKLTPETVEAELMNIAQAKEEEVSKIEEMIALIQSGNFEQARVLAGESPTETGTVVDEQTTDAQANSTPSSNSTEVETPQVVAEALQSPMIEQPTAPVTPAAPQPTAPVTPATPVAPTAPVTPMTPTVPTAPTAPVAPSAPSMPTLGTPVAPTMPTAPSGVITPPTDPFNLSQAAPVGGLGSALAGFQPASPNAPIQGLGGVQPATATPNPPTSFQSILGGTAFDASK